MIGSLDVQPKVVLSLSAYENSKELNLLQLN